VIAAHSIHRMDSVSAALGIHLIVYCAVGAGLAFGLYALLQPSRTPNSGLAVYKPPPAAVVTYAKRSPATVEQPIADPEPVTTGRSTPEPELKPTITAPPSRTARRPNREVRIDIPRRRAAACIPGYDSSGAQTRPCG
jgi:hypothetical protein